MTEYASVALQVLGMVATVAGAWAVMRSQVADLRYTSRAHAHEIASLQQAHARLDERNTGFSDKLDGVLEDLKHVTGQLQTIAIEMARSSPRQN